MSIDFTVLKKAEQTNGVGQLDELQFDNKQGKIIFINTAIC